jgi:hypothetical protein
MTMSDGKIATAIKEMSRIMQRSWKHQVGRVERYEKIMKQLC